MNAQISAVVVGLGAAAVVAALLWHIGVRAKAMRSVLREVAAAAGWNNLTDVGPGAGIRGAWQSFAGWIRYRPRRKGHPPQINVSFAAASDLRLTITRKTQGFFRNKPLMWFGPPLVEIATDAASDVWIRGDRQLAEALFGDATIAPLISSGISRRHDVISIDATGLRAKRTLSSGTRDDAVKLVAASQIELAQALVTKLAAMK